MSICKIKDSDPSTVYPDPVGMDPPGNATKLGF